MKKNAFFIVMLVGMLGFAFSAEKGALSLAVPSSMASEDSKDKDSKDKDSKDKDSKDKDSKDKDSKDKDSKDKDSKDKASDKDKGSKDDGDDASCVCPPGISSCMCADGSEGDPGPGSSPAAPSSLRSVHGN